MLMALTIITPAMPGHHKDAQGKQGKFLPVPIYYTWVERDNYGWNALSKGMHWVDSNHRPSDYEARVRATTPQIQDKKLTNWIMQDRRKR